MNIGVRELRADLAAHLRRAGAGQRVVVTVGGREVAQLGPVHSIDGQTVLADLITAGLVVAPRRIDAARPAQAIPVWSGVRLDRALKELRG
jgi:prevent-host-death family protein